MIRLGYVHLRVTDLEEARNHYSNALGMEVVASEPGKLWLKCFSHGRELNDAFTSVFT